MQGSGNLETVVWIPGETVRCWSPVSVIQFRPFFSNNMVRKRWIGVKSIYWKKQAQRRGARVNLPQIVLQGARVVFRRFRRATDALAPDALTGIEGTAKSDRLS